MHTLGEIANQINAKLIGDPSVQISSLATLNNAKGDQLSYIAHEKFIDLLKKSKAGAIILNKNCLDKCPTNALLVDNVYLAFARISHYFQPQSIPQDGVDPSAKIDQATIANTCTIGKNTIIGKDSVIGANVVIEDGVHIGSDCYIHPNVVILKNCQIGNHVTISSGAVIGAEGFGNARDENGAWHSIAHVGRVVIGDNVTIGANTTIDCGTIEDTQIHNGVRIDNLVHIAHNVIIGQDSAIAANTGIAGSTVLGKRCMVGGMVGIVGHLTICDDVIINATSTVNKNITKPGIYTGIFPLMPHKTWQNVGIWLIKLDKIANYLNIKLKTLKGQ